MKYFILISTLMYSCLGWWENGHMLTAQIAEILLQANNPETYQAANNMVLAMNGLDYDIDNTFVTSAVWPDDIKDAAMNFWDAWHFYDRPINPDGLYLQQDPLQADSNSCNALERAVEEITQRDGTKITTQKAIFIRYILHIVGDIHQPLHSSNFYNETYNTSAGDAGGNFQQIITPGGIQENLHAFWDQGGEAFQTKDTNVLTRPLSQEQQEYLREWAKSIMDEYPKEYFGDLANDLDFFNWTSESWHFAENTTYPLLQQQNQLTKEYEQVAQELCKKRVALAGYRLTNLLIQIMQPYAEEIKQQQFQGVEELSEEYLQIRYFQQIVQEKYNEVFKRNIPN